MCRYTLKIENSQKSPKLFSHHPRFAYRAVDIRFGSVSCNAFEVETAVEELDSRDCQSLFEFCWSD